MPLGLGTLVTLEQVGEVIRWTSTASSTVSAATPERKHATCQPESAVDLIAAPPVEKSAAAARMRSLESRVRSMGDGQNSRSRGEMRARVLVA